MLIEPSIDKEHLRARLCHLYGVTVTDFTFVPKGEESWSYVVACDNSSRYFVKIHISSPPARETLDFVWQLRQACQRSEIVCPIPSRSGEPTFTFDGYATALFEYVSGPTLADHHPHDDQLFRLGELLAQIHRCIEVRDKCPSVERFDIPFQDGYARAMETVKSPRQKLQGYQAQVAELMQLAEKKVDDLFQALRTDQQNLRELDLELVVCHGEPSPGNVLFSPDGKPHLVDWNTAILAPKERDLVFFLEPEYYAVLDSYRSVVHHAAINDDVVRFYRRHWTLGEIVHFGSRILFSNTDNDQSEKDMDELLEVLGWIGVP